MTATRQDRKSTSDVSRDRASSREVVPGVLLLLLTQGSLIVANPQGRSGLASTLWALSPLVPIAWLAWSQLRSLGRSDERQRLLQLEAMAVGFGVLVVSLAAVGVLDGAQIGDTGQQVQITFVAGVVAWVAALGIRTRQAG